MESFADHLINQIKTKRSIICIGLDPRIEEKNSIPSFILKETRELFSNIDEANNEAIWRFNKEIIDKTHTITPVYKPQIAFYERYNALDALKNSIDYIHEKGALVILDAKRNDIGSTSLAYAQSVYDYYQVDAVTVNSYFGIDGVAPFLEYIPNGKGVILLLKTSNPSSGEFQDLFSIDLTDKDYGPTTIEVSLSYLKSTEGKLVRNYIQMARLMQKWIKSENTLKNELKNCEMGYSSLGGVVGATYPEQLEVIRKEIPKSFILIPGYGAQGGTAKDIVFGVNEDGLGAIVNSSRAINFAYQDPKYKNKISEEDFSTASFNEASLMKNEINQVLKESGKIAY